MVWGTYYPTLQKGKIWSEKKCPRVPRWVQIHEDHLRHLFFFPLHHQHLDLYHERGGVEGATKDFSSLPGADGLAHWPYENLLRSVFKQRRIQRRQTEQWQIQRWAIVDGGPHKDGSNEDRPNNDRSSDGGPHKDRSNNDRSNESEFTEGGPNNGWRSILDFNGTISSLDWLLTAIIKHCWRLFILYVNHQKIIGPTDGGWQVMIQMTIRMMDDNMDYRWRSGWWMTSPPSQMVPNIYVVPHSTYPSLNWSLGGVFWVFLQTKNYIEIVSNSATSISDGVFVIAS